MRAVVMAGGEGSRLRPLTSRLPKPLAPVVNKPVMEHILDLLKRHGITEVVATLHYLADEIESFFGDGSAFGVTMHYVVEDTPLGTAGAVKMAEHLLRDDTFLIISGDALTNMDLSAMLDQHRRTQAAATIALQRVTNPLEYGVVVTDENQRITRFLEKPSWGEIFSDTINTGMYVLEPAILDYMERGRNYDFSKDLFPRMLHEGRPIQGYITPAYWTDIGNLQAYHQANLDALNGKAEIEMPGTQIAPGVWAGEGCRIHPDARLVAPVAIGRNVTIEADATVGPETSIGDSSIVGKSARIARTTSWQGTYFGEYSSANDCTIADKNIVKDHVSISEGAVIGSGCILGSGAAVRPNIKMWPEKSVSSGAIVSMSLIYGIKWPDSLFGAQGVSGLANVEITPEFAMKLGQAFGSYLKPGQTVLTSRDAHPASRIMNRCIISGLLSVGIHVEDLQAMPLPVARYATSSGGDGAVHTRVAPGDPNDLLIEILDGAGINVDKNTERKIENVFFREDFRRTAMDEVGTLAFRPRAIESYTSEFLATLRPRAIAEAGFRVVVDYAFGNAALVVPRILGNLRVDLVALNAYYDEGKARTFRADRDKYLAQMRTVTQTLDATLGVLFDHDGENFALVDDRGHVVEGDRLLALLTLLVVRAKPGAKIAMPVTVPSGIEELAKAHGATVVRMKSDRRTIMAHAEQDRHQIDFAGSGGFEAIFPEFQPAVDGLYAAVKLMELLALEKRRLSDFVDMLPEWHVARRSIPVPWERKGEVMRTLLDEQKDGNVELIDGIRVNLNGGWVLVLPDASDPTVNVYAEGTSDEEATRYADDVTHRIERLIGV
ncbi:MAG: sugar phosphate nucleotidyltransferase [Candidatus Velthaea sp.]